MKYYKSRYTPHFKLRVLSALDASGGRWHQIEQQFDVPHKTLLEWHRRREQIFESALEFHNSGQKAHSVRIDMMTQQLINALPEKIESAKLTDSLRAITMLDELRLKFQADEQNAEQAIERLMKNIDRYRELQEDEQRAANRKQPSTIDWSREDDPDA